MRSRYVPSKFNKQETELAYKAAADEAARSVVSAVLLVLHRRKWHADKICKLYDDIIALIDMPPVFGERLSDVDVQRYITEKYGIDFGRLHLNVTVLSESEMERLKSKGRL